MANNSLIIELGANVARLQQDMQAARNTVTRFASDARREFRNLQSAIVGTFSMYQVGGFLKSSIDAAEKMENSLRGLGGVARYSGVEISAAMQEASKLAADGLLDVSAASKSLQNLLQRGFKLDEAVTMLTRLKDAAAFNRQSHLTLAQAVESATEGIKNENSILVDNAGVTKNVSQMWKEYAREHGKTLEQLTIADKRTAEYNGILKETEAQVGNAKLATEGLTGAKAKLSTEVFKLKAALGDSLTPAFLEIAKAANYVMQNGIIPFIAGVEILATKAAAMWERMRIAKELYLAKGAAKWNDPTKEQIQNIDSLQKKLDEFDRNAAKTVDEQIQDIVNKWSGAVKTPQLGKDTGKRREDVVAALTGTSKAAKKAADEYERLVKWAQELNETASFNQYTSDMGEFRAELEKNAVEAQKNIEKAMGLKGALREQTIAAIEQEQKRKDESARMKEEARQRELSIEGVRKETEAKKELMEISREAAERSLLAQEAMISSRLFELDLAKQTGASYRAQLEERIRLEQQLLDIDAERLRNTSKVEDYAAYAALESAIQEHRRSLADLLNANNEVTGSFLEGWKQAYVAWNDQTITAMLAGKKMFEGLAENLTDTMGDMFFSVMKGRFDDLGDAWKSFCDSMLRVFAETMAQMAVKGMMSSASNLFGTIVNAVGSVAGFVGGGAKTLNFVPAPGTVLTAHGNAFVNGRLQKFASGGILSRPTLFPLAGGMGLAGEAGTEAVLPLKRTQNGNLGVESSDSGKQANINLTIVAADARSFSDMVKRNPGAIIKPITDALKANTVNKEWRALLA